MKLRPFMAWKNYTHSISAEVLRKTRSARTIEYSSQIFNT